MCLPAALSPGLAVAWLLRQFLFNGATQPIIPPQPHRLRHSAAPRNATHHHVAAFMANPKLKAGRHSAAAVRQCRFGRARLPPAAPLGASSVVGGQQAVPPRVPQRAQARGPLLAESAPPSCWPWIQGCLM
jgi:hypothetical protein